MSNIKTILIVLVMLMFIIVRSPVASAQQNILIYHVYYNDVLIIQLEVISSNNAINVKVIPLYDIDTRSYYIISDLIVSPSKYKFVLNNIREFAESVNALIESEDNITILKYKVGKFTRVSVYETSTGILIKETNIYDGVNITTALVTKIGNNLYYNTITITVPLAIVILGLAAYSYIKREEIRIL